MSPELKYFLHLVNCTIHNKKQDEIKEVIDWNDLLEITLKHNMTAMLYPTISSLKNELKPKQDLVEMWGNIAFQLGLRQYRQMMELRVILEESEKQGILMIPFKGLLLANLYPDPLMRTTSDADIFIRSEDKVKIFKILEARGYTLNKKETMDTVFVYQLSQEIVIELHTSLWEEYVGDRRDVLDNLELTSKETLMYVKACDINFVSLGYQQHLIYQIYHMVKHFSLSGVGVRHLTDLTLFINAYYEYINFDEFWSIMESLHYTLFCYYFFSICIECFELRADVLNGLKKKKKIDITKLIDDILDGGVFGNSKEERYHARNIIKPYLKNDKIASLTKLSMVIGVIFPSAETIYNRFNYVHKYKLLYPIAWVHYNLYILCKKFGKHSRSYGDRTINQAKYRLQLLQELEIINK